MSFCAQRPSGQPGTPQLGRGTFLIMETWKDIPGFESKYQASTIGRIRSIGRKVRSHHGSYRIMNGKLLAPIPCVGYFYVNICGKLRRIHRLIAITFIANPNNKPQINHKNGIKTDNHVENLEWVTASENGVHAYKNNLITGRKGTSHHNCKLRNNDIYKIRKLYHAGNLLQREIALKFKVHQITISRIVSNKAWSHI